MRFVCATVLALLSSLAQGQAFPSRTVTLVVPFSPGTGIDILARVIAPKLSQKWGHPVVIENKPGASGNIGTDFVAKSAPDGHTLMVTVNTFAITPSLIRNTPYDVVNDFAPISKIAVATYCFAVNPAVPQARAGRIRILGVTGSERSPQFPEAPTFREQGIDFMDDVDAWYAVIGPAKLPAELVAKLNADVNAVMGTPD